nr:hypothetical protein [uncultured Carboxylicivirga sp.]
MKKIFIIITLSFLINSIQAQTLLDFYKKGPVKLVPDAEYAVGNDWNSVFETYNDTLNTIWTGGRKALKILPDGSAVVSHAYHNYYSKFSPKGKFSKEFKVKDESGKIFKKTKIISDIINDNTFFTGLDNMGNMLCFDFDGNYKKTLKLDYMSRQQIALPNGKIAVVGWAIWAEKFRDFVAIVDYDTNEEKIIWEQYTDRCQKGERCKPFTYTYRVKKGTIFNFTSMPYQNSNSKELAIQIATSHNHLIVAIPSNGEIKTYDLDGNLLNTNYINWEKKYLSVEEQKEIQRKAIENYKYKMDHLPYKNWADEDLLKESLQKVVEQMEMDIEEIKQPIPKPTFSTIIKDSDDNLLFFEFPEEANKNRFNVWIYQQDGSFVCHSSFICDDYNLQINPSKLVFHNGYLYGLQTKKDVDGIPLRLVRFKLASE